jgi:hypothetical protein
MRAFLYVALVGLGLAISPLAALAQSFPKLETIANSDGLASMQMELRRAGARLDRMAEAVDRRADKDIEAAIIQVKESREALEPLEELVGHLLPEGSSMLFDVSIAILRRTVGARGGITGIQTDTWRLHEATALRSGAEDARRAAEAIFQEQTRAGREHRSRCKK